MLAPNSIIMVLRGYVPAGGTARYWRDSVIVVVKADPAAHGGPAE
jgi:hypothetical protein